MLLPASQLAAHFISASAMMGFQPAQMVSAQTSILMGDCEVAQSVYASVADWSAIAQEEVLWGEHHLFDRCELVSHSLTAHTYKAFADMLR